MNAPPPEPLCSYLCESEVQRQRATKHCQPPGCERMGSWALNPRWAVWAALTSMDFSFPRDWLALQHCLTACLCLSEPWIYYQPFLSSENLAQSSAQRSCPQGSIILVNTNIIKASRRAGRLLTLNESSGEMWFLRLSSKYTTALRYKNRQAVSTTLKVFCLFFFPTLVHVSFLKRPFLQLYVRLYLTPLSW